MYTQALIEELRLQMKQVQEKVNKLPAIENKNSNLAFVESKGEKFFNPKYIDVEEVCQIEELEKFLNNHPEVNNADLTHILRGNVFYFSFLKNLQENIPNLAQTLRALGSKAVTGIYVGTQLANVKQYEL